MTGSDVQPKVRGMARSLRIERENGVYHLINRGNYRQDLFTSQGAHQAFERCLFETCEKCGWVLEGFCVMSNHFHLVVRTPRGNLIYGMKWLQGTFANRYHRFNGIRGKLFQGRYKSLIVEEDDYLGALQHYVHLNPVRAGICGANTLRDFRWSSFWYLFEPRQRPSFLDLSGALAHAGGLKDTPVGRRKYQEYLAWLAQDKETCTEMAFDRMCHGWALGSKEFKRELLQTEGLLKEGSFDAIKLEGRDLREVNELLWEQLLRTGLRSAGKNLDAVAREKKSADWKIWIATQLKCRSSAPNAWIARELNMGVPQAVTILVNRFATTDGIKSEGYRAFNRKFTK